MKRFPTLLKRIMIIFSGIILLLVLGVIMFLQHPTFGKAPSGERLARIQQSPQFKNGKFENFSHTPTLTEGFTMTGIIYNQFFKSHPNTEPKDIIPSIKTDLHNLDLQENILVWFGHSSYFMQMEGKRFLVDPVLSGNASPVPGSIKAFKGTDQYNVTDFPEIDYLLISHDHYDHLDYTSIVALRNKVKTVVCGLGVGSHFEYWGYSPNVIIENDWDETLDFDGLKIHTAKARHFSGRALSRNNTLWLSYVLETPKRKIYVGGDSGYDSHLAEIGKIHGPFDLVILDNGQYNVAWKEIHFKPEEVVKAAIELQAKRLMPVHSAKFSLAMHPWDEPLKEVYKFSNQHNIPLLTPIIGEKVRLDDDTQIFKPWWNEVN
ncbi:MBL fold metallo-hydrolase [Pleomorphovibrio marinus]|uniref:MBL fold metallo-hydrolase n=1 Tax=Pleomorphovibrio marinus TaxID=2164132 RepID=UPI000E0BB99F|nr:MBL fold metallo-hydrolase [Pleomorphovibrio marinus]